MVEPTTTDTTPTASPKPLYILGSGKSGTPKSRPPCKFFASGSCAAGDLCPFEHAVIVENITVSPPSAASITNNCADNIGSAAPTKLSYSQLAGMSTTATATTTSYTKKTATASTTIIDTEHQCHYTPPPSTLNASTLELCVFAVTGKCRFGSMCRNVHGLQCPRCLLYCLHPTDLEQNEEHIRECLEKPVKASNLEDEELECGICLEKVLSKADPRFGLLNCEHAFCLSCIRQWRSSCQQGTNDPTQVRSCPLCRVVTYFIVPCSQFIRDGDEKAKVIEQYKRKVQSIPCRHYDYGRGRCPFGSSCFYSHLLPDGTMGPLEQPRSYVDANEQVKVVREFRLSDFLPVNNS